MAWLSGTAHKYQFNLALRTAEMKTT